jgi:hypothetical protein
MALLRRIPAQNVCVEEDELAIRKKIRFSEKGTAIRDAESNWFATWPRF